MEFLLHRLFSISPYRCRVCYQRYFRIRHFERHPDSTAPKPAH